MQYPYPPLLAKLQSEVEKVLGLDDSTSSIPGPENDNAKAVMSGFNHVMLNRYDDGTVYIGRHRDTKENNVRMQETCFYTFRTTLHGRLSRVSP